MTGIIKVDDLRDAGNNSIISSNGSGTFTYTFNAGSIARAALAADIIDGTKIADDAIDSEHYAAGSIDTAHIADLNVTTAKIAADAITGAKIADDAIDSEHYTDGSIDTAHIGATQVTGAKLNADVISAQTALAETPALDDEAIISDAGTLKRLDIQHLLGAPAFSVWTNSQSINHQSWTGMAWDAERFDNNGNFDSSTNYRFTCPSGGNGRYFFIWKATIPNIDDGEEVQTRLRVSGSSPDPDITQTWVYQGSGAANKGMTVQATLFCNLTSGNYVDTQIYHNEGATQTMTSAQWTGWKMSGGTANASDSGF